MTGFSQLQHFFAAACFFLGFWIHACEYRKYPDLHGLPDIYIWCFETFKFLKKKMFRIFLGAYYPTKPRMRHKIGKTHQLKAMIIQSKITLGFSCLPPLKSPWQEVLKTPLVLIKAIIWLPLVAVQSLGNLYNESILKILNILELLTSTKCAKIIALILKRGVLKTSCHGLINAVKHNNPKLFLTVWSRPKVDEFCRFWGVP